jgi:hypothetical protein
MNFVIKIKITGRTNENIYVANWRKNCTLRTFELEDAKFFDSVESAEKYIKLLKKLQYKDEIEYKVELV